MKLAMGCDEAACRLKAELKRHLSLTYPHIEITDFGVKEGETVLYPDVAFAVANAVARKQFERAILLCGTGLGMAICANKVPGVRAAVCHDPYSAQRSRMSNNAQILCMGERVIGVELAKTLVDIWLSCDFSGGRSTPKIERIHQLEIEQIQRAEHSEQE